MIFARYGQEWGQCSTCGFDVPVSLLRWNGKYGWQCTAAPGANCLDTRPDREDYEAQLKFPKNEGARRSKAPLTNTANEGVSDNDFEGYGYTPYGSGSYGS